eukprot:CAMPEP_0175097478 /NCGR_PEP_ID=MMETSP0086_2-20121207/5307_1 /TAXON_ID=136419 /ORGANISM="Unknown Unknown, Strain D1" /LENGTH=189 /DNA_ID=CAMNT_0016370989 /DNA_START=25 /DNA_END=594 /DNA_ORIENTATION=-
MSESPYPQTPADKVLYAEQLKAEGNALFGQGQFQKAISKYVKIFAWTTGLKQPQMGMESLLAQNPNNVLPTVTDELSQRIDAIQLSANLNATQCYLKLNDPARALKFANKALELDQQNIKALFRRGLAFAGLRDNDSAERDLAQALALSPNDTGIQKTLKAVRAKLKAEEKKHAKKWQGAFEKMNLDEE